MSGTSWQSADNCTTFSCENNTGQVVVTSSRELCPDVSHCDPQDLVNDTCCQICKEKPQDLSENTFTSCLNFNQKDDYGIVMTYLSKTSNPT